MVQECDPQCAEFWPQDPENQGRPLESVLGDERLRSLPRFADVTTADVREPPTLVMEGMV